MTAERSLQDLYFPNLQCFGCGPANPAGLGLQSFSAGAGSTVAEFTPSVWHDNGLGYLNGGIAATLLDCHSAAAVTHEAYERGWPALPGAALPYVTAGLDVTYLRPAPLGRPVSLRADVVKASESAMEVDVSLVWDGKERSCARAVWKRWRPR